MQHKINYPYNYKLFRNILGFFLGLILISFGVVRKAKREAKNGKNIIGIAFHNPSKNLFTKSIRCLKRNGFSFISTQQLIEFFSNKFSPPPGSVWLTFDDGWKENLSNVIPYIVKNDIPATFFISTGPVSKSGYFWWSFSKKYEDLLRDIFNISQKDLYTLPEQKRSKIMEDLATMVNYNDVRDAMEIGEVQSIAQLKQVTIGAHTSNHVITTNCTDTEIETELTESKKELEQWIGDKVICFAYPNGIYNSREKFILKESGIVIAATTDNKFITKYDDVYFVPRFVARDDGFLLENICHMVGIWPTVISKIKTSIKFSSYRGRNV